MQSNDINDNDNNQYNDQGKLKLNQSCHYFKCLICFLNIFVDEDIEQFREGYVHKVCIQIVNKESDIRKRRVEVQKKYHQIRYRLDPDYRKRVNEISKRYQKRRREEREK